MRKIVKISCLVSILFICCGFVSLISFFIGESTGYVGVNTSSQLNTEYLSGNQYSNNKILVIRIDGTILDQSTSANSIATGYVFGYDIKNALYQAVKDQSIKGVIILVSSGGGTVTGSRAIADGIKYYISQTKQPVYAYIQGFAASGAYMAISPSTRIFADYGSLTGSIGVIFGAPFQYYDKVTSQGDSSGSYVVTQNGIETFYISAGLSKDLGNPYRKMTQSEIDTLQADVNEEYQNFVDFVSQNRGIETDTIKNTIKALIYGNDQAITYKLIDEQATYNDVVDKMASKAGITDYQVITIKSPNLLSMLLSSYLKGNNLYSSALNDRVLLMYGAPNLYTNNQ